MMKPASKQVEPFAVWELTDEAIFIGLKELETGLGALRARQEDAALEKIQHQLDDIQRCYRLQCEQEGKKLFPLLDRRFQQVVGQSDMSESLGKVQLAEESVQAVIEEARAGIDKNKTKLLKTGVLKWSNELENHLRAKQKLIKHLLPQLEDTDWKRGSLMQKVLAVRNEEFIEFQLKYVTAALSQSRRYSVLKRYMEGLKMSSDSDQYLEYKMVISQAIGPATWQLLVKDGLDGDGEQPPPAMSLHPCEGCAVS